jgi:transcriptional regulator with GAF, ATPase, and Fis domain
VPLILIAIYDSASIIVRDRSLLESVLDEKAILTKALKSKESQLNKLQKELEISEDSPPSEIINKIDMLKTEIESLKASQDDDEKIEEIKTARNFEGMVFISRAMQEVVSVIERIAPKDATVLILGESGSGKELVAHAIHNLSGRREKEFVAVNCAALSESLLESELFGHVKGAFTNAVSDKKGLFEIADKGTIFLDEIGETSEQFQAKLLRIIQSGDYQKVGSSESRKVDVRVITATNKDLFKLTGEKRFREDLYYRLNVININVPSLKDRPEDVEVLAHHFVKTEDEELNISRSAMKQLAEHEWKGNVRELESAVKRASIFAKTDGRNIIRISDLPEELRKHDKTALESLILDSLRQKGFSHSSINETAQELGNISRTIVSENFRGLFFKKLYLSDFNFEKAVAGVTGDDADDHALEKVSAKGQTYLTNIKKDLEKVSENSFEVIKKKFSSKYKNLPQRYHIYLDGIIRHLMENDLD